jgi:hypothetical protein
MISMLKAMKMKGKAEKFSLVSPSKARKSLGIKYSPDVNLRNERRMKCDSHDHWMGEI